MYLLGPLVDCTCSTSSWLELTRATTWLAFHCFKLLCRTVGAGQPVFHSLEATRKYSSEEHNSSGGCTSPICCSTAGPPHISVSTQPRKQVVLHKDLKGLINFQSHRPADHKWSMISFYRCNKKTDSFCIKLASFCVSHPVSKQSNPLVSAINQLPLT